MYCTTQIHQVKHRIHKKKKRQGVKEKENVNKSSQV